MNFATFFIYSSGTMRQLKGGKVKESAKEKKQRKKEFAETQKQVYQIALPTLIAVFIFITAYVYIKTRPRNYIDWFINCYKIFFTCK